MMPYSTKNFHIQLTYEIDNHLLQRSFSFRHLSVTFDFKLSFNEHVIYVTGKALGRECLALCTETVVIFKKSKHFLYYIFC